MNRLKLSKFLSSVLSGQRGTVRQFQMADRRRPRRGAASEAGMRWSER